MSKLTKLDANACDVFRKEFDAAMKQIPNSNMENVKPENNKITTNEFQRVVESENLCTLHAYLLKRMLNDFNIKTYVDNMLPYLMSNKNFGSDLKEILYMTSASYLSQMFAKLMEENFPERTHFAYLLKKHWSTLMYFNIFSPKSDSKPTKTEKAYLDAICDHNGVITEKYFQNIVGLLKLRESYNSNDEFVKPGVNTPYNDFEKVIHCSLVRFLTNK